MTATETPAQQVRVPGRIWWLSVVVIMALHALAAAAQPIFAGAYLNGHLDAITVHEILGSTVGFLCLLLVVATLLYRLLGKGPWWPFLAAVGLLVVEALQIGLGYSRSLGLHVPIGVFVVGAAIGLLVNFARRTSPPPRSTR